MPHLIVEYSDNTELEPQTLLHTLHQVLAASGVFDAADIKVRARSYRDYLVAGKTDAGFVHLTLLLLDGRSDDVKAALGQALAAALRRSCPPGRPLHISVDVRDLNRATYTKDRGS